MDHRVYAYLSLLVLVLGTLSFIFSNKVLVGFWTLIGLIVAVILICSILWASLSGKGLLGAIWGFVLFLFLLWMWAKVWAIDPILISTFTVFFLLAILWHTDRESFEKGKKAQGLVKHKGKWGTPEQVEEWKMTDQGLVRFNDSWVTPQEKARMEKFELEQLAKGLVKYNGKWGLPKEVEKWKQDDYEWEQLAKGLIKHGEKWITPKEKFELEQNEKGLTKFVNRKRHEIWGTPQEVKEWNRIELGLKNNFADYSPREFEKFVAGLFKKMGYEARLAPYVSDYGVDVIAQKDDRRILIQVKKYGRGHLVGNREVRDALGAVWGKADKAIFITTSDFTEQAYIQAKDAPIELWNHRTLEKYIERYFIEESESAPRPMATSSGDTEDEAEGIYREAFPQLSEEEAELQETQEVDMDFENEDYAPDNESKIEEQTSITEDKCEAEQVCLLPTKVVENPKKPERETEGRHREVKEGKIRECRNCGWEISEHEYETKNGLCYTCWKQRVEVPQNDPVSAARRGGLVGADRAGTW